MHRKYFYLVLAFTLFFFLLILFFFLKGSFVESPPPVQVSRSPYATHVTGVGIVEPESGNIYIGIPFDRIVREVNVAVNDRVAEGDILIELDREDLIGTLSVKLADYDRALAELERLKMLPRQEDLSIGEGAFQAAAAKFEEAKSQYEMVSNLQNIGSISKEERDRRFYRYSEAKGALQEAQSEWEKTQSGTWYQDIRIAELLVATKEAEIEALESEIERTYIKSPIDGTVLQVKIKPGETPGSSRPSIVLGNIDQLNLRVSVDQFSIAHLCPKAPAVAYRRGDHTTEFPLAFVHIEPLMVPKKYLTNAADEKVDTQVFEILYRIAKEDAKLFVGEQMDVYINIEKQ